MNPALPPALKSRTDALLEGVSRKELAVKAAAISERYRAGGGSAATITDEASVIAYVLSRLPATYAVAAAVFDATREAAPDFAPKSFLDVGAGPGTASWAAAETWPDIAHITMADSNPAFLEMARTLAVASPSLVDSAFTAMDLNDARSPLSRADLVAASFVLAEIAEPEMNQAVERLWSATNEVLVLIEPGTPVGFARIRDARERLVGEGAHVLAPCTHDNACPISGSDWCHFSQRLPRSRDHLKVKGVSVPFEDERYSYVVVSRRAVARGNLARIIAPPEESKAGLTLPLCAERGLQRAFVSRRQRDVYAVLRKAKWGDTILSED
jgi:ribosomal protein RSM22 (predicted rRNA methylase)